MGIDFSLQNFQNEAEYTFEIASITSIISLIVNDQMCSLIKHSKQRWITLKLIESQNYIIAVNIKTIYTAALYNQYWKRIV